MADKKLEKSDQAGALAVPEEVLAQAARDEGHGIEGMGRDDVALPFIRVLQSLSPEVSQRSENFVEDAEPGMFFNTVTEELWPGEDGIRIIPCQFEKVYNEWVPRNEGGGFVASYDPMHPLVRDLLDKREGFDQMITPDGNHLTDTINWYVLVLSRDGAWQPAILSFTSTKMKSARRLNALVAGKRMEHDGKRFTPPSFTFVYRVRTVETENDQGRFFITRVADDSVVGSAEVYGQARKFHEIVRAGDAEVDYSKYEPDTDAAVVDEDDDNPTF